MHLHNLFVFTNEHEVGHLKTNLTCIAYHSFPVALPRRFAAMIERKKIIMVTSEVLIQVLSFPSL
jgi:hypothetical protein